MHHTLLLLELVAVLAILIFSHICAYTCGKHRGWKEVWRTYGQYAKEGVTLSEGETLVGVVERKKRSVLLYRSQYKGQCTWCITPEPPIDTITIAP
jgi:hypothetical protein